VGLWHSHQKAIAINRQCHIVKLRSNLYSDRRSGWSGYRSSYNSFGSSSPIRDKAGHVACLRDEQRDSYMPRDISRGWSVGCGVAFAMKRYWGVTQVPGVDRYGWMWEHMAASGAAVRKAIHEEFGVLGRSML
jgi:hypothetical protein